MVSWQTRALNLYLRINALFAGSSKKLDIARERADVESMASLFKPLGIARHEPVTANGVPAEWALPENELEGRVILFLHGGSFATGSISSHRTLASNVALATQAHTLLIDYRLTPEHPFPAGVEDTITAYEWILAQGIPASQIIIAGDSAGGDLVLALLIHLRDSKKILPAAAICLSPLTDLTLSGTSWMDNAGKDLMLNKAKEQKLIELYLGKVDPHTPLASPFFADLRGLPPLLLQVGSHEFLLSDVKQFAEKAKSAGVDVTLEIWDGMQHEWQFAAKILPEGRQAIARIGAFAGTIFPPSAPQKNL